MSTRESSGTRRPIPAPAHRMSGRLAAAQELRRQESGLPMPPTSGGGRKRPSLQAGLLRSQRRWGLRQTSRGRSRRTSAPIRARERTQSRGILPRDRSRPRGPPRAECRQEAGEEGEYRSLPPVSQIERHDAQPYQDKGRGRLLQGQRQKGDGAEDYREQPPYHAPITSSSLLNPLSLRHSATDENLLSWVSNQSSSALARRNPSWVDSPATSFLASISVLSFSSVFTTTELQVKPLLASLFWTSSREVLTPGETKTSVPPLFRYCVRKNDSRNSLTCSIFHADPGWAKTSWSSMTRRCLRPNAGFIFAGNEPSISIPTLFPDTTRALASSYEQEMMSPSRSIRRPGGGSPGTD